jgi:hypothetical protein
VGEFSASAATQALKILTAGRRDDAEIAEKIRLFQRNGASQFSLLFANAHGILQRAAKSCEADFHEIAVGEADAVAEAEAIRAEKMHVNVSRAAVLLEFEMMMLEVLQAVAHFGFAGANRFRPDGLLRAPNFHLACY